MIADNLSQDTAPKIDNRFFCIVDRAKMGLAAVISSYLQIDRQYLPMLVFPAVTIAKPATDQIPLDEHHLSVSRALELDVRISNALTTVGGCDYLVLAGLSEMQKSYLSFLKDYNIIEIESVVDVGHLLKEFTERVDYLVCNDREVPLGLQLALANNQLLQIQPNAQDLIPAPEDAKGGIVVVEDDLTVSTIIGINFAKSIGASVLIVGRPAILIEEITYFIRRWKEDKDDRLLYDLGARVFGNIEKIDFSKHSFATFFTFGVPYSLLLRNIVPCSYVNSSLYPDFFVLNNIIAETASIANAGVVFSPEEFLDEETEFVIRKLAEQNYFVKELLGKNATVFNIDHHVKEFPYDIFHVCSHGGEVDGYSLKKNFVDSAGNKHEVEYDEVISLAPDASEEKIEVVSKFIWRTFDGIPWKSKELKEKNYPQHVFADMIKLASGNKEPRTVRKPNIPNSHAIKCYRFNYQAIFNSIAGAHANPFIFNNTCWSWIGIADGFLSVGARGYIGTLWAIDNSVAKVCAEKFYANVFNTTILKAFHSALQSANGTASENVFIYWGLHFSTLKKGTSIQDSKSKVGKRLSVSFLRWKKNLAKVTDEKTREMIKRLMKWNLLQLAGLQSSAVSFFLYVCFLVS